MIEPLETVPQLEAALRDFSRAADMLGMPDAERRSILGLSSEGAAHWLAGPTDQAAAVPPALARRLGYALPLMQRMVANQPSADRRGRTDHVRLT